MECNLSDKPTLECPISCDREGLLRKIRVALTYFSKPVMGILVGALLNESTNLHVAKIVRITFNPDQQMLAIADDGNLYYIGDDEDVFKGICFLLAVANLSDSEESLFIGRVRDALEAWAEASMKDGASGVAYPLRQ